MKCDEQKPSCLNCTSTGRKCDGYYSIESPDRPQALSLVTLTQPWSDKTSPWNDCKIALAPTLGLPSNEQNNRLFYSFLRDCVPSLTEAMDSGFWQRSILRASSSAAVQHAAIAFAAVYEQKMACQNAVASQDDKKLQLNSSLRYAVAIRTLRLCIAESSQTQEKLEEIMIACLIFIFMEILRGDDVAAATHLDGALKLYNSTKCSGEVHIQATENKATSDIGTAVEKLTQSFLRLDIQSVLYMGSRTPWDPEPSGISALFEATEDIPDIFLTFLEARDILYALLANILNFITPPEGAEKCFPAWCPHPERGFDIYTVFHGSTYRDYHFPKATTRRRHFIHLLSRWKSAFQGFLRKGAINTPEALAGCALLWLTYYTARIKLAVAYTDDECCYDEHLPSFKKIVEHAESYTKHASFASSSRVPTSSGNNLAGKMPDLRPKKTDFKIHSGVCNPLYYTALKCRYKPTRQCALSMLYNAENEGIWNAHMLATIAKFVISIEEGHIEPDSHNISGDSSEFGVPEASRIHCLSLNLEKEKRVIWLRYNKRATDTDGDGDMPSSSDPFKRWIIESTVLTWNNHTIETAATLDP